MSSSKGFTLPKAGGGRKTATKKIPTVVRRKSSGVIKVAPAGKNKVFINKILDLELGGETNAPEVHLLVEPSAEVPLLGMVQADVEVHFGKPTPMHATTVRLTGENEMGLRLLNLELKRPINKLINEAVAEYIESQTESLQYKLEQTLANLHAYRRRDPGFRKAIAQFVEAEASVEDPAEGRASEMKAGPALTMVREALRGG